MNAIVSKVGCKFSDVADKISNSKVYRTAEKIAVGIGAGLMTVGVSALNTFAAEGDVAGTDLSAVVTAAANVENIMKNAKPFIEPAIIIMCGVCGLRLGMKFLRGSAK